MSNEGWMVICLGIGFLIVIFIELFENTGGKPE